MKVLISLFVVGLSLSSWAQKAIYLHVDPVFNGTPFELNTVYTGTDGTYVNFDYFNYYLSQVLVTHDGGQQLNLYDTVFLVKQDQHLLYLGNFEVNQIEHLQFLIGVPKNLNTQSGANAQDISLYPENHPLSFQSPSMYWGWQAGYIHQVTGGNADGNGDAIPETYFEMHNLGDHNQQAVSMDVIATETNTNQLDIYLWCNVERWIKNIPLATVGMLHDETGYNKTMLENVVTQTVFTQPGTAAVSSLSIPKIWTSLQNGSLVVKTSGIQASGTWNLWQQNGKNARRIFTGKNQSEWKTDVPESGFYLLTFTDENGNTLLTQKVIVP